MLTDSQRSYLNRAVHPMRIIVGALAAGVVVFLVIVIVMRKGAPEDASFLTYVAVAMAGMALVVAMFVPLLITAWIRSCVEADKPIGPQLLAQSGEDLGDVPGLAGMYQTRLIMTAAFLEAAAFLCLVAYMIEGQRVAFVSAAVMLLLLLSQIPTLGKLESWVTNEMETVEQFRQLDRFDGDDSDRD